MRSPIIAFSIVAAATVSPTLVSGAPASPNLPNGLAIPNTASASHMQPHAFARQIPSLPETESKDTRHPRTKQHVARVDDSQTAGGNAYSGASSDTNGGTIYNEAGSEDDTITNTGSSKVSMIDIIGNYSHRFFRHCR